MKLLFDTHAFLWLNNYRTWLPMKQNRKKVETYRFNGNPHLTTGSIHPITIPVLEARIITLTAKLSNPKYSDDQRWTQRWLDRYKKELDKKRRGLALKSREQAKSEYQSGSIFPVLLKFSHIKLFTAFLLLAAATLTHAREFRLPDGKPAASIELPDAWQPALIARGVQVKSPDGSVFLSVEATATAEEMTRIIDETDATLKGHKVRLDRASRESRKYVVNDLPVEELRFTGRDEQGAAVVGITFVSVGKQALVLTRWASAAGDAQHQPELARMLASIRAVKD